MDGSKEERGAIKKTEKRIMAARVKWTVDRIRWKKTNKKEKSGSTMLSSDSEWKRL